MNIVEAMVKHNLAISMAEARRCIQQKATKINDDLVTNFSFEVKNKDVITVGKRKKATVSIQ